MRSHVVAALVCSSVVACAASLPPSEIGLASWRASHARAVQDDSCANAVSPLRLLEKIAHTAKVAFTLFAHIGDE